MLEVFKPKGNRVNIPEPGRGNCMAKAAGKCVSPRGKQRPVFAGALAKAVTQTDSETVGASPGKSFLFFVRHGLHGIGLAGEMDVVAEKHRGSRGVRSARVGP
jgi:hypothetical protein